MMMSLNVDAFQITGPLWGESKSNGYLFCPIPFILIDTQNVTRFHDVWSVIFMDVLIYWLIDQLAQP